MAFETTTNWQNVEIWLQQSGFKMNMMPILCNNYIYGKVLTLAMNLSSLMHFKQSVNKT